MGEIAGFDIGQFLRGRDTSIDRVAVGMTPKAFDDIAHALMLGAQLIAKRGQSRRQIGDDLFGDTVDHIEARQMIRPFAMAQRDDIEQPLPRLKGCEMAIFDPLKRDKVRLDILGIGPRRATPKRAGKLIQCQQQRQPPARRLCPAIQQTLRGGGGQIGKMFADMRIDATLHPVENPFAECFTALPETGIGKPEIQHILGIKGQIFCGHGAPFCPSLPIGNAARNTFRPARGKARYPRARVLASGGDPRHCRRMTPADLDTILAENFAPWVISLDIATVSVGDGTATFRMPLTSDLARVGGIVSGQALAALADTCMVLAAIANAGKMIPFATTNLDTQFLRPGVGEAILCTASVVRAGRAMVFMRAEMTEEASGKTVATANATFFAP